MSAAGDHTVKVKVDIDLTPALAALDAFIAAMTDARDRLEAEIDALDAMRPESGDNEGAS